MAGGIVSEQVEALQAEAFATRQAHFDNRIYFFAPGLKHFETEEFRQQTPQAFRPISLTGSACALQCEHCKSKILEPMIPLDQKEGLLALCRRLAERGTRGVLISGGSQPNGQVPLRKYLPEISRVKQELGLRVMVHCGVVDEDTARGLRDAGVDGVMLDIIGAEETIRQVYHLDLTPGDFERSLAALARYGHSIRPHIILGLHFGRFLGEEQALEMIARYPVDVLVLVILTPLVGTPMQGVEPPAVELIANFFGQARLRMPHTPIMLGCARPLGDHKTAVDRAAIDYGLNGLAYPAEGMVRYARNMGLEPVFRENSCSCGF
ncbi:MAG: radical SAM protein [Calditrichaeota bacterium]|nr:MAG: radical SAM protein [Calditrichota bacterium]